MKNSSDTIGNRTRNLPACSALPQPTIALHMPNHENRYSDGGLSWSSCVVPQYAGNNTTLRNACTTRSLEQSADNQVVVQVSVL